MKAFQLFLLLAVVMTLGIVKKCHIITKYRFFTVLLSLSLVMCPLHALAEKTYSSGDYEYVFIDKNSIMLTKWNGSFNKMTVPTELDGYKVVGLGERFFFLKSDLETIYIPDSVILLENNPLRHAYNVTSIHITPDHPCFATIDNILFNKETKSLLCCPSALEMERYEVPKGIKTIEQLAFEGCDSLLEIIIPEGVTGIKNSAFLYCSNLAKIILPSSITSIEELAFAGCNKLIDIALPAQVNFIGDYAFYDCNTLKEVAIPYQSRLGKNPFKSCNKLTKISVAAEHQTLKVVNSALIDYVEETLIFYPLAINTESYIIPSEVSAIGEAAFYGCDALKEVIFHENVKSIGAEAFYGCDYLEEVVIPESVAEIGDKAFAKCPNLVLVVSPNSYAREYAIANQLDYTYINSNSNDWLNQ